MRKKVIRCLRLSVVLNVLPVLCLILANRAATADEPAPASGLLRLASGGFVPGELKDSPNPAEMRWQGTAFRAPFEFPIDYVEGIHWPSSGAPAQPRGEFYVELAGGDALFGTLIELNGEQAVLEAPAFGRAHIDRSSIVRMDRIAKDSGWIYLGPDGLKGWQTVKDENPWKEEGGRLVADQPDAAIIGNLGLPARAAIELHLSWVKQPDFIVAFGVGDDPKSSQRAFRFEVWNDDLVVLREAEKIADVAVVTKLEQNHGRILLRVYLDQTAGRILVYSSQGKPLADLKVSDPHDEALPGIYLANTGGTVRLEQLRIGRWNGEPPDPARFREAPIVLSGGETVSGQVSGFDPATKEFLVRDEDGDETRVAQDRVASIFFPEASTKPLAARQVVAFSRDGARLSGDWLKVNNSELWLEVPGITEAAHLPVASLRSLLSLRHDPLGNIKTERLAELARHRPGTLLLEDTQLLGYVMPDPDEKQPAGFAWQPQGSETASALRPGISGQIIFQGRAGKGMSGPAQRPTPAAAGGGVPVRGGAVAVPAPPAPAPPAPVAAPLPGVAGRVVRMNGVPVVEGQSGPARLAFLPYVRPTLHLRVGDSLPATLTAIDEEGIHFKSPVSQTTFVAHDKVKAAELAPESFVAVSLTQPKRDRLLMLPRMQKESPPTHLLYSTHGDFLRGRLLAMDDKSLKFEVQLEERTVPRNRVARIVWFHPDELDPAKAPAQPSEPPTQNLVQAVSANGLRMTFVPQGVEKDVLLGKSDVLGPCKIDLNDVNQLLIGTAITQASATLPYAQWRLHHAPEPKFVQDDGSSPGSSAGADSPLVGKPAPDFELDLLAGQKFHLASAKGKVVVLDFWATWCGPCVQAMPQVEAAAADFRDQNVQLVAVNLQEKPEQITAMLKRLKLDVNVALDRDGVVAEKYSAHAIPQTVIIDREGKVARLFIGGGPHLGDQLREALKAVLDPDGAKGSAPSPKDQ